MCCQHALIQLMDTKRNKENRAKDDRIKEPSREKENADAMLFLKAVKGCCQEEGIRQVHVI